MKKAYKIALNELRILFYSPIAWILIILFLIQASAIFSDVLYTQETKQQVERPLNVLTKVLFAGEDGVLTKVQKYLFLYIPILTMGLFSREKSSGSLKLLTSSPITIKQMVLGKYLSMMLFCLILVLILGGFVLLGSISIINIDLPFTIGGILGIYLLLCAYSSIGMYMSSLTSYQIVSAISTLVVLAGLNYVGTIGQQYDFIRKITYWMSMSGRADNFVNGLISTKDILYFILIMTLFISFTLYRFKDSYSSDSTLKKSLKYTGTILIIVFIGYISTLPKLNTYIDTTRFKDRTLTKNSQEIVKKLKGPIKINSYVNVVHYSASKGAPVNRIKDMGEFETYRRFIPEMDMNYIYYYDTISYSLDTSLTLKQNAKKHAKTLKINFHDVKTPKELGIDFKSENNRLVRYVSYKGDSVPLRMFNDLFQYPQEAEISAAIKRLIIGPSTIAVLMGNGERGHKDIKDKSYRSILNAPNNRASIINQGFKVINVDIRDEKIPLDIDALVIADPIEKFSDKQIRKIKGYIESGGNLLILGEPKRASFINPILEILGVKLLEKPYRQITEDFDEKLIQLKSTDSARKLGIGYTDNATVTAFGASGIMTQTTKLDFQIHPILEPDKSLSTYVDVKSSALIKKRDTTKHQQEKTEEAKLPLSMALTRDIGGDTQKILVLGDADILSNSELSRTNVKNINTAFALELFKWFSNGKYPVSTGRERDIDTHIKVTRDQIKTLKWISTGGIPIIIGGMALIFMTRRKRK